MLILSIVGIGLIVFNTLFIVSACKVSSKSDAWEEEIRQDIKKTSYIIW